MSIAKFASLPSIGIGRTAWSIKPNHSTSFQHGKVIPILCERIMPGDSISLKLNSLIRMSTPIAPIMGSIFCKAHVFFVPQRLLWDHSVEFYGENREGAGPLDPDDYLIPAVKYGVDADSTAALHSVSHYLHKPLAALSSGSPVYMTSAEAPMVSVLKERAYWLVINEYYRKKQIDSPILIYKDDTGRIAQGPGVGVTKTMSSEVFTCRKFDDYFVASTISPQYSLSPVALPLGDTAPIVFQNTNAIDVQDVISPAWLTLIESNDFDESESIPAGSKIGINKGSLSFDAGDGASYGGKIFVDLAKATASNINELRTAFSIQRYLERDNYACTYPDHIKAHFNVTAPMGLLQRPELLGSASWLINVNQVLSTAGAESSTSTKLGQPGANSTTFNSSFLCRKAFVEDGYLLVMIETKHKRLYSQGILRDDLKRTKWEFYTPEMAHLGDQATKRFEIFAQSGATYSDMNGNSTFGFQSHWAEYRFINDAVSGLIDPQVDNGLDFWSLAEDLDKTVVFDSTFVQEDRDAIARALVTGSAGDDYIADFNFDIKFVRPMPLDTMPGLIDHVGAH